MGDIRTMRVEDEQCIKAGKRTLGTVGRGRSVDRPAIKMALKGIRWMDLDWIQMAEDRVRCR